jgi:hypothetical protein
MSEIDELIKKGFCPACNKPIIEHKIEKFFWTDAKGVWLTRNEQGYLTCIIYPESVLAEEMNLVIK